METGRVRAALAASGRKYANCGAGPAARCAVVVAPPRGIAQGGRVAPAISRYVARRAAINPGALEAFGHGQAGVGSQVYGNGYGRGSGRLAAARHLRLIRAGGREAARGISSRGSPGNVGKRSAVGRFLPLIGQACAKRSARQREANRGPGAHRRSRSSRGARRGRRGAGAGWRVGHPQGWPAVAVRGSGQAGGGREGAAISEAHCKASGGIRNEVYGRRGRALLFVVGEDQQVAAVVHERLAQRHAEVGTGCPGHLLGGRRIGRRSAGA